MRELDRDALTSAAVIETAGIAYLIPWRLCARLIRRVVWRITRIGLMLRKAALEWRRL